MGFCDLTLLSSFYSLVKFGVLKEQKSFLVTIKLEKVLRNRKTYSISSNIRVFTVYIILIIKHEQMITFQLAIVSYLLYIM